jgi:ABC-type transporter Mla subunit MlaD
MKSPLARDFLVGLTAMLGAAGIVIILFVTGEARRVFERNYFVTLRLESAAGLTSTSRVLLNGVRVGQIADLRPMLPPATGAQAVLRIRADYQIPNNVMPQLNSALIGDAALDLVIPAGTTPDQPKLVTGAVLPADGQPPFRLSGLFDGLAEQVQGPLDELTGEVQRVSNNFDTLTKTYTELGERATDLLRPLTAEEAAAGKAPTLATVIASANTAITNANRWLGDDSLLSSVRDSASKLSAFVDRADGAVKALETKATAGIDAITAASNQAGPTLRSIQSAAEQLQALTVSINQGQGTLGQLATNPDLYNSLRDAAKRLDRTLTELQLLIEKSKAEGIPIRL